MQLGQAVLGAPEEVTGAPLPEVLLGNPEAVVRLAHDLEPRPDLLRTVVREKHAVALRLSAPDTAPQLVQLAQAEALGVLDHDQARDRDVDTDFNNGRRDQNIALSKDKTFSSFFKKYQLISLTNFGTAFGMGFVVIVTMIGYGHLAGALVGLFGAFCGSIISTRIMQRSCLKSYPELDSPVLEEISEDEPEEIAEEGKKKDSIFMRALNALLDGGKNGVDLGLQIIPGVLIITTFVLLITFSAGDGGYNGSAYQGVPILPWLAEKIHWVFEWLFGFKDMELIAFPMTALGSVGASLGLIPAFNSAGIIDGNAIAVFTAIGMCWSGFLSTHTAMLDSLGYRKVISKALGAHAVAGLCAGVIAHFLFLLISLI